MVEKFVKIIGVTLRNDGVAVYASRVAVGWAKQSGHLAQWIKAIWVIEWSC